MSINLCFKRNDGVIIDFPFDSPTFLTKKVLAEKNNYIRLLIIENQLDEWGWDEEDISDYIDDIIYYFNKGYKLSSI